MIRLRQLAILTALVFGLASNAVAGNTMFGGADCGEWVKAPSPTKKAWLLGYVSGLNVMITTKNKTGKAYDPLNLVNSASQIYSWMDNYCQKNPLRTVSDGASILVLELMAQEM